MNSTIKLFAELSKSYKTIYQYGLMQSVLLIDPEKFAKMIVDECIRELEVSRKCDPYTGDVFDCEYNTCIKDQTVMLKEHFGIKYEKED